MLHVLPRRPTAVLALAAALLAGPLAASATARAAPSPSAGPAASAGPTGEAELRLPPTTDAQARDVCALASAESPVVVEVTTLAPRAPVSLEEPFQVAGRLVNCGRETLSGLQVRLVTGGRLSTRSQLRRATEEPVIGSRRLDAQDAQVTDLGAGASTRFDVRVQVADLRLGERNGVYPLAVQARARTDGGPRGPVGLASTFVPWFPEGPLAPTRVAWVLPLVDEPHRAPSGVLLGDELEQLVAGSGRLSRALLGGRVGAAGACEEPALAAGATTPDPQACRGEAVPLTWAVDPDLVSSVEGMTRQYTVLDGGQRAERPASDAAGRWMASLRAAATEGDVLALPYGDPDVVALTRTGSPIADDVTLLQQLGQAEVRRLLDVEPLQTVSWPPPGPVTGVVDTVSGSERRALVVRASALTGRDRASSDRTPGARTTLPSPVEPVPALVPDDALSDLAGPDPTDDGWQGERLAAQRWLAETAMIAAERPGESRTLVVAPDRRADLSAAVLAAAVADTGRLPWLCGVPLADAAAGTERCAQLPDRQAPVPADALAVPATSVPDVRPLPPSFVQDVAAVRRDSDQFTEQVLAPDDDGATDLRARLLRARGRAESTAWRNRPTAGRRMLDLLRDDVDALRGSVTLVGQPALLTGREGTVQLVVQNSLAQPVNVGVRLDPTSAARLSSADTAIQVVPGRSSQQVSVRVEARTSGRFTARVGLVDASGQPFGSTVELAVRSTQYGRVALAVTGVAAAVLLVAAGVRITRRALRPPQPEPAEPPREPARPGSGV